jgi:UDP-N-acetylglucosamine 2-epimerase
VTVQLRTVSTMPNDRTSGDLDMLALKQNAQLILTDSGSMQQEAHFFGVSCVTLGPRQSGWRRSRPGGTMW